MKKCVICELEKHITDYSPFRNDCKSCRNERRRSLPKKSYPVSVSEKKCCSCLSIKVASMFDIDRSRKDGLHAYCSECRCNKAQKHYVTNSSRIKQQRLNHYYTKQKGNENFRSKNRERQTIKESIDVYFKLKRRLRNRLYYAILNTNWRKKSKFSEYIGCERDILISYLESKFTEGMSWENYGKWHIDHIIPLSSADSEEQLYKLCHYSNLQPLWAEDNIKKGSKS